MKIVKIAKLVDHAGKDKYFLDLVQAGFYVQSCAENIKDDKIEQCPALFKDQSYLALKSLATHPAEPSAHELEKGRIHNVYLRVEETDSGSGFGTSTYISSLTTVKKDHYSCDTKYKDLRIIRDEHGTFFEIGDALPIETSAPEYGKIKLAVDDALIDASARHKSEYQQSLMLFNQRKADHALAKEMLARKQAELEMQAQMLERESMSFSRP